MNENKKIENTIVLVGNKYIVGGKKIVLKDSCSIIE